MLRWRDLRYHGVAALKHLHNPAIILLLLGDVRFPSQTSYTMPCQTHAFSLSNVYTNVLSICEGKVIVKNSILPLSC